MLARPAPFDLTSPGPRSPVPGPRSPAHLNQFGASLTADGAFGSKTSRAVISFQTNHGLDQVDGIVGPKTWNALSSGPTSPTPVQSRVSSRTKADRLQAPERLDAIRSFCTKYPAGRNLGQCGGIYGFTQWEIKSGRIAKSSWWRQVNGHLILDMQAAQSLLQKRGSAARSADPAIDDWISFARAAGGGDHAPQQALFWTAHQTSLHLGIHSATAAYANEPVLEQKFIQQVVKNVDTSALLQLTSSNHFGVGIGNGINAFYPSTYPAKPADLGLAEMTAIYKYPLALAAAKSGAWARWIELTAGYNSTFWG